MDGQTEPGNQRDGNCHRPPGHTRHRERPRSVATRGLPLGFPPQDQSGCNGLAGIAVLHPPERGQWSCHGVIVPSPGGQKSPRKDFTPWRTAIPLGGFIWDPHTPEEGIPAGSKKPVVNISPGGLRDHCRRRLTGSAGKCRGRGGAVREFSGVLQQTLHA